MAQAAIPHEIAAAPESFRARSGEKQATAGMGSSAGSRDPRMAAALARSRRYAVVTQGLAWLESSVLRIARS